MSYQPGPNDVMCQNQACREWYHKALKACPMCDAPHVPVASYPRQAAPGTPPPATVAHPPIPQNGPAPRPRFQWTIWNGLAVFFVFFMMLAAILPKSALRDEKKGAAHQAVAKILENAGNLEVRPYNADLPMLRIVVPVMTTEREAEELALTARKALVRCDGNMTVKVETPAGQVLASRSSIWAP